MPAKVSASQAERDAEDATTFLMPGGGEVAATNVVKAATGADSKNPEGVVVSDVDTCLLYTSPSPRDQRGSRMPSSA